ncbi:hypothetical protein [Leifsonia sp. NPDC058248]|uniref:hypothetical protein n=1 Tax=Leifsonia sp. NPDC058248 TaxID=3346402 RepID=UPI0036D9BFD8
MTDTMTPPMILGGDSPRVHRNDPITSHLAADRSQSSVSPVRARVLGILDAHGPLAAFEVCDLYADIAETQGWPRVHHESPRKRMSDMKRDGLLVDTHETRINAEGSPEVVVAVVESITPAIARSTFRPPENADLARPALAAVEQLAGEEDYVLEACS